MLTDDSLIEWASYWVADDPPGQRARFAEAMRNELMQRAEAAAYVHCGGDACHSASRFCECQCPKCTWITTLKEGAK